MIFDQENMFFDKATDIAASNVIANVGGGDAIDPLFLVVCSDAEETAALTFALETSNDEAFAEKTELAKFASVAGKAGPLVKAKMPYGAKAFLRLVGTGTPAGKITAGLTENVPNWISAFE